MNNQGMPDFITIFIQVNLILMCIPFRMVMSTIYFISLLWEVTLLKCNPQLQEIKALR